MMATSRQQSGRDFEEFPPAPTREQKNTLQDDFYAREMCYDICFIIIYELFNFRKKNHFVEHTVSRLR
ncbi:hypothetical protein AC249_AIPGENE4614 [Exaiptasia diaphana]|nr:hypothetical protein AC249_AIPGENE4614 [Exaiptasia diaphana]